MARMGFGLVVLCGVFAACGGETSSGPSRVMAPPSTPAGDLDASDVRALCAEYLAMQGSAAELCRYLATQVSASPELGDLGDLQSRCEAFERACVDGYTSTLADARAECETTFFGDDCRATVGEIETCFSDQRALLQSRYARAGTCASLGTEPPQPLISPGSCLRVASECPGVDEGPSDPPAEPENPAVVACETACAAFAEKCSLEECPDPCNFLVGFYGSACDALGKAFFDCAAQGEFDCAERDVVSAPTECVRERTDYVACHALGGISCERSTRFDESCAQSDAAYPFGKRCASETAAGDCVLYAGFYYCCPTE